VDYYYTQERNRRNRACVHACVRACTVEMSITGWVGCCCWYSALSLSVCQRSVPPRRTACHATDYHCILVADAGAVSVERGRWRRHGCRHGCRHRCRHRSKEVGREGGREGGRVPAVCDLGSPASCSAAVESHKVGKCCAHLNTTIGPTVPVPVHSELPLFVIPSRGSTPLN
jgi:hypothetical protein